MMNSYYCASTESPAPATSICCKKDCSINAFMCDNKSCSCKTQHRLHYYMDLEVFIGELKTYSALPEHIAKEVKDVSMML